MLRLANPTPHLALARAFATMANPGAFPTLNDQSSRRDPKEGADNDSSLGALKGMIAPRVNVLGTALQPIPTTALTSSTQPATGFFRTNYCDASPLDPGSHTIAALITPSFLTFSASKGNDLSSLFPRTGPSSPWQKPNQVRGAPGACYWCLCASRWWQAVKASESHPQGEAIVPRVVVQSTHANWAQGLSATDEEKRKMLEKYAIKG